MGFFSQTVAAALEGSAVGAVDLIKFDWLPAPSFYWLGSGPLTTADGTTWQGVDNIIAIDGLQYASGTAAPKATFTVSALDPAILMLAQQQATNVKRRPVTVFRQFFADGATLLDSPFALWASLMDVLTYKTMREGVYEVSVSAETVFVGRNKPPYGYYDAQDQAARGFPADTGMNQIPSLLGKTIIWKQT